MFETELNSNPNPEVGQDKVFVATFQERNVKASIFRTLQSMGEDVTLEVKETLSGQAITETYSTKESVSRISNLVKLLEMSPQAQMLQASKTGGIFSNLEGSKFLRDIITGKLSEREKILFDTDDRDNSNIETLFPPLEITDELKKRIKATSKRTKRERKDLAKDMNRGFGFENDKTRIEKSSEVNVDGFVRKNINKFLGRTLPFSQDEEEDLIGRAYKSLIDKFGPDLFEKYELYSVRPGATESTLLDYEDPSYLLLEELMDRGYDIRLFRTPTINRHLPTSTDGLQDSVISLVDENSKGVLEEMRRGSLELLNALYRTNSICYREYIDDLEKQFIQDESWGGMGLSIEEKNRIVAWSLKRRIRIEQTRDSSEDLVEYREMFDKLGVPPADQALLRRSISYIVDKAEANLKRKN